MSNATDYLTGLFGLKPDAPSPEPTAPAPTVPPAQPQAAGPDLDRDAQPEPLDFGPDGWPVGAIEPGEPCSRCGGIEVWIDLRGGRHCQRCDTRGLKRTRRWLDGLRARKQRNTTRLTATAGNAATGNTTTAGDKGN